MKKIMTLLAGMVAISGSANAQYVRVAPEIGLNISNIRLSDDRNGSLRDYSTADPKPGLKVGGIIDIACSRYFSIQPGLFFSQKGYRLDEITTNGVVVRRSDASQRATFNYLEMPLNVMFKVGRPRSVRFIFGGGGYIAYGVSGRIKYGRYLGSDGRTTRDIDFGTNENNDDYRNFDAGGQVFAGILIPGGGYIRAQYQGGVANIDPAMDDDYRLTNQTTSITFGVLMGGRR